MESSPCLWDEIVGSNSSSGFSGASKERQETNSKISVDNVDTILSKNGIIHWLD